MSRRFPLSPAPVGWGETFAMGVTAWPVMLRPMVGLLMVNADAPVYAYWDGPPIRPRERAIESFDELAASLAAAPRHPEACVVTLTDPSDWLINNPRLRVWRTSGLVVPRLTRLRFERTCYDYEYDSTWLEATVLGTPAGDLRAKVSIGSLPHLAIVAEASPLAQDERAAEALHQVQLQVAAGG